VNLLLNSIGVDQAKDLVGILKEHPTLKSLCGNKGNETELDMSGKIKGAGDAIMLVPEIIDNEALMKLDISNTNIGWLVHPEWSDTGQGGSWTGKRYKHIDGRKQDEKPEGVEFKPLGVVAVAAAIKDMGALTKLILKDNAMLTKAAGKALASALAGNSVLTELDVSDQAGSYMHDDGPGFVQELAAGISDMRALSILFLKDNRLATRDGGRALAGALSGNLVLTALDVSSRGGVRLLVRIFLI
jgi:hypothetical protein